jgi:hypothetical protein
MAHSWKSRRLSWASAVNKRGTGGGDHQIATSTQTALLGTNAVEEVAFEREERKKGNNNKKKARTEKQQGQK